MNKRSKACQFDRKTAEAIVNRDQGCMFCNLHYHLENSLLADRSVFDIMHIVNKSHGGLGVIQNGAQGCRYHHSLMDDGNKGFHEEMLQMAKNYLISIYPEWTEESVTYNKNKDLFIYRK